MDLPDPVSARMIAERRDIITGIACIYTGVGFLYPSDFTIFIRYLL
jgi:hypothetical protein